MLCGVIWCYLVGKKFKKSKEKKMKVEPRHNFFDDGWQIKYAKPPKKEEPKYGKIRLSSGPARINFNGHKGGFSGTKSWSVSVMASVVSGVKDKGRASAFAEYIERPEECICAVGDPNAAKKFKEIENKLLSENPKRVTQRRLIIPVPVEFLTNADENLQKFAGRFGKKYFDVCATWNMALHAGGGDMKNPHIHVIYAPVDANMKNIRDLSKSNYMFLQGFKKDVGSFFERELGIEIRNIDKNQSRKRAPKWVAQAYKRAEQANDGGKVMRDYAERYPIFAEYLDERKRKKVLQEYNDLKGKEKEFNQKYNSFALKTKSIFEKITGKEEQQIKAKVQEIKREVKEAMDLEPLKNINVARLAERLGFERDKYDRKAYRRGDLKVGIDATGRFNSFNDTNLHGKGAIDFVMKAENKDFKQAIEFLSNEYACYDYKPEKPSFQPEKEQEKKILEMPTRTKDESAMKHGIGYLADRNLNLKEIKDLAERRQLYFDDKTNIVFVCRDAFGNTTGAEIKNKDFKGMAKGTDRDKGAFSIEQGEPKTIILTESAIDAMSYKDFKKPANAVIISTGGVMPHTTTFIEEVIKKYDIQNIKIGYDADEAGQKAANALKVELQKNFTDIEVEIEKPAGKDWNEDLKSKAKEIGRSEIALVKAENNNIKITLEDIGIDEIMLHRIRNARFYFPEIRADKGVLIIDDTHENRKQIHSMLSDDINIAVASARKNRKNKDFSREKDKDIGRE